MQPAAYKGVRDGRSNCSGGRYPHPLHGSAPERHLHCANAQHKSMCLSRESNLVFLTHEATALRIRPLKL